MKEAHTLELLSSIDHVHFPKYYGHYNLVNGTAIVMEYIPGENLNDFISSNDWRILSENSKLVMIMTISKNLLKMIKTMHDLNIIHRDLKLGNIMIDFEDATVKFVNIIDYGFSCNNIGIAFKLGNCIPVSVGTPLFMAPQLLDGSTNRSEFNFDTLKLSDIWSFGIILYLLVSKSVGVEPVQAPLKTHSYDDIFKFIKQLVKFGEGWNEFTIFGNIFKSIFTNYRNRITVDSLIETFDKFDINSMSSFRNL